MTKSLLLFFRQITSRKALCDHRADDHREHGMKPGSNVEGKEDARTPTDTEREKSAFLLRRNVVTIRRKSSELRNRHGDVIDATSPSFLLAIVKEMDRALLRAVKDTPLPLSYLNFQDANGTVSVR